jgi:hypothetical protein
MTYPIGSILLIKKYKLPTEEKDKFFIVIEQEGDINNLLSITTSKFYFLPNLIKHGVINQDSDASMYCFEKDKVIGENEFSFEKHTFINHNSNIHKFNSEILARYSIEIKDKLLLNEFQNLVYSFYRYRGTPKKIKILLENILKKISLNYE